MTKLAMLYVNIEKTRGRMNRNPRREGKRNVGIDVNIKDRD